MKRLCILALSPLLAVGMMVYPQARSRPKNQNKSQQLSKQEPDFNTYDEAGEPILPDYSQWKVVSEQTRKYRHNGREVNLSSEHYQYINTRGLRYEVVVFYYPNTQEPWLAIYWYEHAPRSSISKRKKVKVMIRSYFFEIDEKEDHWQFVKDVTAFGEHLEVFKSRYGLECIECEDAPEKPKPARAGF